MQLYIKILQFIKPHWKGIVTTLILTLFYVLFNNISLWVSVDFIREIFSPEYVQSSSEVQKPQSDSPLPSELLKTKHKTGIYQTLNQAVKDVIIQDNRYDTLLMVCLVIFLSFFFKNITLYIKQVLLNFIQINIVINIRSRLHQKILSLPLSYLERRHSGDLTSVVFNDVNAVRNVLQNSFGKMFVSPVQILGNVAILFMISWQLSLITFIVVPISTFVIVKIGQGMRRRSRKVFRQIADVVSTFQEAVNAIRIVKAFTNEQKEVEKFNKTNNTYFKRQFSANKLKFATSPINEVLLVMVLVFLLWYGGNLVYASTGINAEDFIRFLVFLFTMFQPIKDLSDINNVLQSGFAAAERIFQILDETEEVYEKKDAIEIATFSDSIKYQGVNFRYSKEDPIVLKNISLEINKGEMVAFVGPSGSGKTTIVNLLPRFYDIESGLITLDGINITALTLHSLRNQMSIVTQDTILFNDTIRTNIAYGMENVSEADIIEAAKVANAWEFIEKTEKGLDTHIGEKGTRLSGGQKQRLSIARAILKNPPILILDEATSALDTESERLVQDAIDNLLKSRTVLVIAHRLSTITSATKIVVLNNGIIEAIGTHNELLEKSKTYRKLSKSQMIDA
ncbi:MAG: ABC transporter ATP-binding protein [Calditrichae bacterium]|nr:ABC transporter ATP-binding protein [Calditrichota bacterium]MCB9057387.1 ABC transporter ATP-binding protein [Calditrichia bacterium]